MKTRQKIALWLVAINLVGGSFPVCAQLTTLPLTYYVARVKDINPGASGSYVSGDGATALVIGETLYFSANTFYGAELWKSDGTAAGTQLVKNINPSGPSNPDWFTNVNGTLFFAATGPTGRELYKSDGTAAGSVLVKEIYGRPGASANPRGLTNVNGTLFFVATNGTEGEELWKSDGTAAGTVMVRDIKTGSGSSVPTYVRKMAVLNGAAYLVADDGVHGEELWKSDGTTVGTVLVKDIHPLGSGNLFELVVMNNLLYLTANDGTNGAELWKSDGTAAGTVLVKNLVAGSSGSNPQDLEVVNNTLFFRATVSSDTELYKSDGTVGGTVLVKNINPGNNASSFPSYLTNVNGTLYFTANDGTNGTELWKSDGTAAGTVLVENLTAGGGSSNLVGLTAAANKLFFQFQEPWKSSGTAATTSLLDDINPSGSSAATGFLARNTTVFFWATHGSSGMELYKYASCFICSLPPDQLTDSAEEIPATFQLKLRPNPVHHTATVEISGADLQSLQLQLMTLNGELIENRAIIRTAETEQQAFDVSRQPAGFLLLRATSMGQQQTLKILKTDR
ncbi:hypothetical protein GCM10027299_24440 [Larkinella ripae]